MYHSIDFADPDDSSIKRNTWDDWHLLPTTRPFVAPPPVVTKYVEIPGFDGSVDLTEALVGRPVYQRRTGNWKFIVANGYGEWHLRYSEMLNFLHGRELVVRLEDDPGGFYKGRLNVEQWSSEEKAYSEITIAYELEPFKYDNLISTEPWLWDTFYFGNPNDESDHGDTIRDYGGLVVDGTLTIRIVGGDKTIVPDLVTSAPITVTYGDETFSYTAAGTYHTAEMPIQPGENEMTFTGNAVISIVFRGGSL